VDSSCEDDDDERPEMSCSSSIMTKPFAVMILLLTTRVCGNNLCEAWICRSTAGLLQAAVDTDGVEKLEEQLTR